MIYADFAYYKGSTTYGGTLITDEAVYNKFATQAAHYMDFVTLNRISLDGLTEKIQNCACELTEFRFAAAEQSGSGGVVGVGAGAIRRESVGNHMIEYFGNESGQSDAQSQMRAAEVIQMEICRKYLTTPINLMYVGVITYGRY